MRIPAFSRLVLFGVASLTGLLLITQVPMSWLPVAVSSKVYVQLVYPHASPREVERSLTAEVEGELANLTELEQVYSVSGPGQAHITLSFKSGSDLAYQQLEIRSRLQRFYARRDQRLPFPEISLDQPSRQRNPYFLMYAVQGPDPELEIAQRVRPLLQRWLGLQPGLQSVALEGPEAPWIEVLLRPAALAQNQIQPEAVEAALARLGEQQDLGLMEIDRASFGLRVVHSSPTWEALGEVPVAHRAGRVIRLAELADYRWRQAPARQVYRVNGRQTLMLRLQAESGANQIELANRIYPRMARIEASLPPGYRLDCLKDETQFLRKELNSLLFRTGLGLVLLLSVLLLWTLNLRYASILFLCLLGNLGITFLLFYLLDLPFHLYSLAGFAVSFGLIVDNAILMLNALRQEGSSPASIRKAFSPILAATLTSLVGLGTVYFLPKEYQGNLLDFCATVALCLGVSLLVAGYFVPALVAQIGWGKRVAPRVRTTSWNKRVSAWALVALQGVYRRRWLWLGLFIWTFGLPVYLLPSKWEADHGVAKVYNASLGSPTYQKQLRPHLDKWLGGLSRLFYEQVRKGGASATPGRTRISVSASPPNGWTVAQLSEVMARFEAWLDPYEALLERYETQVYSGQQAVLEITFPSGVARSDFPRRLQQELQRLSLEYSDIKWSIQGRGQGFDNYQQSKANFFVLMKGFHYAQLDSLILVLQDSLLAHPRIKEVNPQESLSWNLPDRELIRLALNPLALSQHQTPVRSLVRQLGLLSQDWHASSYVQLGDNPLRYPVQVKSAGYEDWDLHRLMHTPLVLDSQRMALRSLAQLERSPAETEIHKEDQQYIRMLSYVYLGTQKFGSRHLEALAKRFQRRLPPGFSLEIPDGSIISAEQRGYQALMVALIVGLIFVICAMLFESLVYPLLVIAIIPMAYLGVFATFYLFEIRFDQGAFASLLLLAGLTVNHTLFLVYSIRHLPHKSIMSLAQVFRAKLMPILLTTFSTCAGLLPMLLDGQRDPFWFAFAAGTIGGLIPATALIFLYLPLLFRRLPLR